MATTTKSQPEPPRIAGEQPHETEGRIAADTGLKWLEELRGKIGHADPCGILAG